LLLSACAAGGADRPRPEAPPPPVETAAGGDFTRAVAVADLDGDGREDLVAGAAAPGGILIRYGEGEGTFGALRRLAVEGDVHGLAVADVNGDGRPDLLYSVQGQSSGIRVFLNQGGRRFHPGPAITETQRYEGIRAVDLNGDGRVDLVAANATSEHEGGIQVWWGDGRGGFLAGSGPTVTGLYLDVLAADFDGDGLPDLAGAGWGSHGALRVWLGRPGGRWASLEPVASGNFYALSAADLDRDGKLDLLAGTYRRGVRIFAGDGRGRFFETPSPPPQAAGPSVAREGASYWQAVAWDLDEDGWPDVVAGSLDHGGLHAWRNLSGKGWEPLPTGFPQRGNLYGLAVSPGPGGKAGFCVAAHWGEGLLRLGSIDGAGSRRSQGPAEPSAPVEKDRRRGRVEENDVFKMVDGVAEYKIGPGDLLEVLFWEGASAARQELPVQPNGRISFGLVEQVPVAGLTASEAGRALEERLKPFFRRPRIEIRVKEHQSRTVRLLGALGRGGIPGGGAGEYRLKGRTTLLEMLAAAGGTHPDADLKAVRVRRQSGETLTLNLYQALTQGDLSQDVVLNDGDLVFVPTLTKDTQRVYVFGEVQRPGAYPFSGQPMRLLDAISEAGGTTPFAYRADTRVVRGDVTRPEILSADLARLIERGDRSQNLLLAGGDLVYVPRSPLGDVKLFYDQIRPLLEMVLWPARVIIDWRNAADITGVK
ncbi:MAG: FG-GAP-like repeat-containing protein, partial [Desulfobacterales bacterium]